MGIFTHPTSYRLASAAMDHGSAHMKRIAGMASEVPILRDTAMVGLLNDHESHPDFGHLTMLVFSAVLEVVCVALPGYIVARRGMFDAEAQKMLANMNVQIFTPCLGTLREKSRRREEEEEKELDVTCTNVDGRKEDVTLLRHLQDNRLAGRTLTCSPPQSLPNSHPNSTPTSWPIWPSSLSSLPCRR